jgi:hypothetical protein
MSGLWYSELRDHYWQGRLIPFIGAGVSASVRWTEGGVEKRGPSWSEMVDQAARDLGFDNPDLLRVRGTDLQILEYFRIKNHGHLSKLTNHLYAEMRPPDEDLRKSKIHERLARMEKCQIIYTTNYDDFIERALSLHGRSCAAVAVEAQMGRRDSGSHEDHCEVVKFHGDFNYPEYMVVSESHYEQRLTLSTAMDLRLRADMLGRVLLFVGYSFRDPNVSYLFRLVNEHFRLLPGSATGRRAYILSPDPSDFEIQLFRARNIEVLPIRSRSRTEDIVAILDQIRG